MIHSAFRVALASSQACQCLSSMTVTVKLFAILRDTAGVGELALDLPAGATVADAVARLAEQYPALRAPLARSAAAVNLERAGNTTVLNDRDELALLPPVSGG